MRRTEAMHAWSAYDPIFRAKLVALYEQGVSLTTLSARFHVAREGAGSNASSEPSTTSVHVRPLFTFAARSRAVADFVWYYNHERPPLSMGGMTPVGRRKLYFRQAQ